MHLFLCKRAVLQPNLSCRMRASSALFHFRKRQTAELLIVIAKVFIMLAKLERLEKENKKLTSSQTYIIGRTLTINAKKLHSTK